jgi:negative regulator of flagellin synthesis FlgM
MTIQPKTRGTRMKITGAPAPSVPLAAPAETVPAETAAAGAAPASAPAPAALQSDTLAPALDALKSMPEIDHARVAELRDALARGELPFDPARLAGLIERFHGKQR